MAFSSLPCFCTCTWESLSWLLSSSLWYSSYSYSNTLVIVCRCYHLDLGVGKFSSCSLSYMHQLVSSDICRYHIGTGVPGIQWFYRIGNVRIQVGMLLLSTTLSRPSWLALWRGPAQDVPFFYTPSHFSELNSCKSIISTNFPFIFIFK